MLNESLIRTIVGSHNFERGESYYRQGAVRDTFRQGDQLLARVEGSQYEPYEVKITLAQGGIGVARCTCPYAAGGNMCKHVALLTLASARKASPFALIRRHCFRIYRREQPKTCECRSNKDLRSRIG
jgi:uncharacterized Zn finger protein